MRSLTDRLWVFHVHIGRITRPTPTAEVGQEEIDQILDKLQEEFAELHEAVIGRDLKKIADGLGDLVYVAAGMALQFGIDIDEVLDVVHRSNMTKDPGGTESPVKGAGYREPKIDEALQHMDLSHRPQGR